MERKEGIPAESRVHLKHRGSGLRAVHGINRSSDYACMGGEDWQGLRLENPKARLQAGLRNKGQAESWILIISVVNNKGSEKELSQIQDKTQE